MYKEYVGILMIYAVCEATKIPHPGSVYRVIDIKLSDGRLLKTLFEIQGLHTLTIFIRLRPWQRMEGASHSCLNSHYTLHFAVLREAEIFFSFLHLAYKPIVGLCWCGSRSIETQQWTKIEPLPLENRNCPHFTELPSTVMILLSKIDRGFMQVSQMLGQLFHFLFA